MRRRAQAHGGEYAAGDEAERDEEVGDGRVHAREAAEEGPSADGEGQPQAVHVVEAEALGLQQDGEDDEGRRQKLAERRDDDAARAVFGDKPVAQGVGRHHPYQPHRDTRGRRGAHARKLLGGQASERAHEQGAGEHRQQRHGDAEVGRRETEQDEAQGLARNHGAGRVQGDARGAQAGEVLLPQQKQQRRPHHAQHPAGEKRGRALGAEGCEERARAGQGAGEAHRGGSACKRRAPAGDKGAGKAGQDDDGVEHKFRQRGVHVAERLQARVEQREPRGRGPRSRDERRDAEPVLPGRRRYVEKLPQSVHHGCQCSGKPRSGATVYTGGLPETTARRRVRPGGLRKARRSVRNVPHTARRHTGRPEERKPP